MEVFVVKREFGGNSPHSSLSVFRDFYKAQDFMHELLSFDMRDFGFAQVKSTSYPEDEELVYQATFKDFVIIYSVLKYVVQ